VTLWSDVHNNHKRLIHKWKHYFPIYERHFKDFVYKPVSFIEIGCGQGGSLQMWKQYFGPHARIVGIDINPRCKRFAEDQIEIHIGNQEDPAFLQRVIDQVGIPDIVVDDGSHVMSHIVATFNVLYPRMLKNGVYLVEDLHTAYWKEYEGGLRRPGSFIEICKNLIDELNAEHSRGALPPTEFTRSTTAMHFYDSVVVFERGASTRKGAPMWGGTFDRIALRLKGKLGKGHPSPIRNAPKP
jgi:SAM-dependent methyltransferase